MIEIENITETYNGTKYAYTKEGVYDTEYIAECIEYGEEFITIFFAPIFYKQEQLMDIGNDLAQLYGGNCIQVTRGDRDELLENFK